MPFEDRSELFPWEGVAGVLSCGCQRPHLPPADVSLFFLGPPTPASSAAANLTFQVHALGPMGFLCTKVELLCLA